MWSWDCRGHGDTQRYASSRHEVLANPYPLLRRLRTEDRAHWEPFSQACVVTRSTDVVTLLHKFSAYKPVSPETVTAMGQSSLDPGVSHSRHLTTLLTWRPD